MTRPLFAAAALGIAVVAVRAAPKTRAWEEVWRVAASGPPWSRKQVRALLGSLLEDPGKFWSDSHFRRSALARLSKDFPPDSPAELRRMLLFELGQEGQLRFSEFEGVQAGWRAVPRSSAGRSIAYVPAKWSFSRDDGGTIDASVYSLPSTYFDPASAAQFLSAVRHSSPRREILVMVDPFMEIELNEEAKKDRIELLETFGRNYTPWTRDTFCILRARRGGRVLVLLRPYAPLQRNRRTDNSMGRELIKDLPDDLDRHWGRPVWALAPVPFHNGQVLLSRRAAWISLHTLEPRILEILHLAKVPVETFGRRDGVRRYVAAARRAASELSALYGRPVKFIHPLPESGTAPEQSSLMVTIGGGAGFDLDSIVTLLDSGGGAETALVADVEAGRDLLRRCSAANLAKFGEAYGLGIDGEDIRRELLAYQGTPRAARLGGFLDLVSSHLARALTVARLPVFLVPTLPMPGASGSEGDPDFLIGWNNVIVERRGAALRAEGFASLLPEGDEAASAVFRKARCDLTLLPPLVRSVMLGGGYRCASNHLRSTER